jgi:hypothetical protein
MSYGAGDRFTENHAGPSSWDIFLHQSSEFPPSRVATSLPVYACDCCAAELSPLSKCAPSKDDCQRPDRLRHVPTLAEVLFSYSQALPLCIDLSALIGLFEILGHY